jgi:branched-chain amino acid transport system ATP-binding protein
VAAKIAGSQINQDHILLQDVAAGYLGVDVLKGVSTVLQAGMVSVLIGHNGAGKTTLARTLMGTLRLARGNIIMGEAQLGGLSVKARIGTGIALVPQEGAVFPTLSVTENLNFVMDRRPSRRVRSAMDQIWAMFPPLHDARERMAGSLSGGQQRMLAIAMGVLLEPRLLILDEPSLGLSPLITRDVMNLARDISQRTGAAVLLIEQNIDAALRVADHLLAMRNGTLVFDGPISALGASSQIMHLL